MLALRNIIISAAVIFFQINVSKSERGDEVGCYSFKFDNVLNTHTGQSVEVCLSACESLYYRYTLIANGSTCFCGNSPGQFQVERSQCNTPCPKSVNQSCGGDNVASVYDTDVSAPGSPYNLTIVNVTETTIRVRWSQPQAFTNITGYRVRATVVHTYADTVLQPLEWHLPSYVYHTELLNMHPGTVYSISVAATNIDEEGPDATVKGDTVIGTPDPSPPDVIIKDRHGDRLVIQIPKAVNVNGPVSKYRIVVSIEVFQQGYIPENLKNYTEAVHEGLPYYITAEIDPHDIENEFTIGDRHTYNGFYNAPLPLTNDIEVSVGVVSTKNFVTKIRYADSSKKVILNVNEMEEVSGLVVALGAGIAIGVVLLLIGIGLLIILRKKIQLARVQRGSQSMPLSMSEPCVEIENAGFLQEDDERVDYYGNLKRKLWNIPRNLIEIDISCVVGTGSYGKFTRGKVQQHGAQTAGLIQVIADRDLERADKRLMLHELDLLIKSSEHENVIALIGICETPTTLFVVLEDTRESLKELLISCRHRDLQNNKFSLITEERVLQVCLEVSRGMDYLHSKKILHKRLCCRNILMGNSTGVAKVSGFGLSHVCPMNENPDYTRWTAYEMLRQNRYNPKSDIWSYGCFLWEIFTLGATPYSQTASKDVVSHVLRGMRPAQPSYVGDELFQLCLQCWQVDPDERPMFGSLLNELDTINSSIRYAATRCLSFTYYNGFNYEPHIPQLELGP